MTTSAPIVVQPPRRETSLVMRAVWFVFIGWWLSALAIGVAYFLCAIIIGLPLGFMIFNALPWILTLRDRTPGTDPDGAPRSSSTRSGSGPSGSSSSAGGRARSTWASLGSCA